MTTLKERIQKINQTAEENWEKAQGMLEMLNEIEGTRYGFLARRVVRFDDPDASTCYKYQNAHDAEYDLD